MKLATLFLSLFLVSCASGRGVLPPKTPYDGVNTTDGISEKEAIQIVINYERLFVGCGCLTGVSDGGDRWIVHGKFGYAGTPVKGTYILKASGEIVSSIGPSFTSNSP